jgi:acyl-CoA dehydrogenase
MTTLESPHTGPLTRLSGAKDHSAENGQAMEDLKSRTDAAVRTAADNAVTVDREARFPTEAVAALRAGRLLGVMVPRELGGEEAGLAEVAEICYSLGRACSSTAMIYAMHQHVVACVLRHRQGSRWHERFLNRLCDEQLLLASATTEGRGGGNIRSSEAAIVEKGSRISLEKRATVISYGAYTDGIVTTARRSVDASASNQVLVTFLREDYSLEPLLEWDTLGMRGTCSAGFVLRASGENDQILPDPYEKIHFQTMVPVSHLTWASTWAGIAAGAVQRAQHFIRDAARHAGGQLPPGAAHFTRASASLSSLRGLIVSSLRRYEEALRDTQTLASLEFQTMINLMKVEASELAVSTVMSAFRAAGLSGYRNDSEFALGRHLRDILSSPIMINNDRILSSMGASALMSPIAASLRG